MTQQQPFQQQPFQQQSFQQQPFQQPYQQQPYQQQPYQQQPFQQQPFQQPQQQQPFQQQPFQQQPQQQPFQQQPQQQPYQQQPFQQQPYENGKVGFNKSFVCSLLGFIRLGIILFHLAGWITSLFVSQHFGLGYLWYTFEKVRLIYFYVTLTGFLVSIPIYIFFLTGVDTTYTFKNLHFLVQFKVILLDLVLAGLTCAISVFCVIKEIEYQKNKSNVYSYTWYNLTYNDVWKMNNGVFLIAAVFGFITVLLYALDVLIRLIRNKNLK